MGGRRTSRICIRTVNPRRWPAAATLLGNLHENFRGNPPLEKTMDLSNNQVGQELTVEHPLTVGANDAEYQTLVNGALEDGQLEFVRAGKLVRIVGGTVRAVGG
jgi:hypothetical protein